MDLIVDGKTGVHKTQVRCHSHPRSFSHTQSFRYVLLTESPDNRIFCHPITLTRLALFLVDSFRYATRQSRDLLHCHTKSVFPNQWRFGKGSRKKTIPLIVAVHNTIAGGPLWRVLTPRHILGCWYLDCSGKTWWRCHSKSLCAPFLQGVCEHCVWVEHFRWHGWLTIHMRAHPPVVEVRSSDLQRFIGILDQILS